MIKRLLWALIALIFSFSGPPVFAGDALRAPAGDSLENRSGLEEKLLALWPDTTPLALQNIEPILIFRAEGGFGDIAYLLKILDGFNARGITPVIAVVGSPDSQQTALKKLDALRADLPADYALWTERDGRLVDSSGTAVAGDRPLRPVLVQHFSQVNPGWARETAEDFVPRLFRPLYQQRNRFLLIGYNAPRNVFVGYLLPGTGEFLNLYMTMPDVPGPHEPNALNTGFLFDRSLRRLIDEFQNVHPDRRSQRTAALAQVSRAVPLLREDLVAQALESEAWAILYTSQGGSLAQLNALLESFAEVHGRDGAVFFTFFGDNPKLWYYPNDYWTSHKDMVHFLATDDRVRFVDLSGKFPSRENDHAKVTVINLPPLPMGAMRTLTAASDLALAPGHNTLMEVIGMAANGVGPKIVLPFPVFLAEMNHLLVSLNETGGSKTLAEITAFARLRTNVDGYPQVVKLLEQLLRKPVLQKRFQKDMARLAFMAAKRTREGVDANLDNRLLDILARVDRGEALSSIRSGESTEVSAVKDYQQQAEKKFRSGLEPEESYRTLLIQP